MSAETFTTARHPLLLFYDGECSFCVRWVKRVVKADPTRRMRYGQQQGHAFSRFLEVHPELRGLESVVVLKRRADGGEDIYARSGAIRESIAGLPGLRLYQLILKIVPEPITDIGYNFFAKYRGALVGAWHNLRPPIEQDKELYVE